MAERGRERERERGPKPSQARRLKEFQGNINHCFVPLERLRDWPRESDFPSTLDAMSFTVLISVVLFHGIQQIQESALCSPA